MEVSREAYVEFVRANRKDLTEKITVGTTIAVIQHHFLSSAGIARAQAVYQKFPGLPVRPIYHLSGPTN